MIAICPALVIGEEVGRLASLLEVNKMSAENLGMCSAYGGVYLFKIEEYH
jgi:hypothetical protein